MVYATMQDVRNHYEGVIADDDLTFITTHLATANTLLDVRVPSLAARITDPDTGPTLAVLARTAVANAVLRLFRNPEGFKGEHGGEYGWYVGNDTPRGRVDFTSEDLADLHPPGRGRSRFRSVGLDDDALCEPVRRRFLRQDVETDAAGRVLFNHAQQGSDCWP